MMCSVGNVLRFYRTPAVPQGSDPDNTPVHTTSFQFPVLVKIQLVQRDIRSVSSD